MKKIIRVQTTKDAKLTESFILEALKPGGYSEEQMPLPSLKDKLAWLSWANLKRPEQPAFIIFEKDMIVAGVFGEPVEQTFDKGESEIQNLILKPGYDTNDLAMQLLSEIVKFYKVNKAKQIHFWILEKAFKENNFLPWQQVAMDSFGFAYKGFGKISKWRGKPIVKIEKHL